MKAKLRRMATEILRDIKDLPNRVVDPDWLNTVEDQDK